MGAKDQIEPIEKAGVDELRALQLKREGKNPRVGPQHFPNVPYAEPMFVLPPGEGGDGNETKDPNRKSARKLVEASAS